MDHCFHHYLNLVKNGGGLLPKFWQNPGGSGGSRGGRGGGRGGKLLSLLSLLLILLKFHNLSYLSFNSMSFVVDAFAKYFFIFSSVNSLASI